jgi:hypothetical protein
MANVFKQIQKEVSSFKSKHIAPQVLIDNMPSFKAEYEKAMTEYRQSETYKLSVKKIAKRTVTQMIYEVMDNPSLRMKVRNAVLSEVFKEIERGNK